MRNLLTVHAENRICELVASGANYTAARHLVARELILAIREIEHFGRAIEVREMNAQKRRSAEKPEGDSDDEATT